jgi:two-component system osmolarity sensor histidine kinase EnvZ
MKRQRKRDPRTAEQRNRDPLAAFAVRRLTLLLTAVVAISLAATILLFRHDRAELLARQFSDTKIVQLQALRAALEASESRERRETLLALGNQYGVRIMPESERPRIGGPAFNPRMAELEQRLRESLGPGTELRVAPRQQLLSVRVEAGGTGYWVGFPLPTRPQADDIPSRALIWSLVLAASLLVAAFVFTRYLARPLSQLNAAVASVGRGDAPPPLPENGPSEIADLNRGFNQMITNLRQLEHDRALLLAGVSHDLRTPLARLRLGLEMGVQDQSMKQGMTEDIAEMDKIIGQFLDFARSDHETSIEREDPNASVAACVDRYARTGKDVSFTPGTVPAIPLRRTALSRLVTNLIDNALAHGAPPIEVTTSVRDNHVRLEVADRGPRHSPRRRCTIETAVHARLRCPHINVGSRRRRTGSCHCRSNLALAWRHIRPHST